ncbi:MAG: Hsp20 family protein [Bacteroidia bacterium]|nr:Hsp20 family protein [Bacteroidia bacterium]
MLSHGDVLSETLKQRKRKRGRKQKTNDYNRREYNYSSWSRSFSLPENCDAGKINAEYKNGELKISIPKVEVKAPKKVKTISVN